MAELYKVQCRVCYGYGHTKDYCASLPRIYACLGPHPVTNTWLAKAISRPYANLRDNVGQPDNLGMLARLKYKVPNGFKDKFGKIKPKTMD